jgi:adenylate kinase
VSIDVPGEELVRRLSGRWVCRDNGHVYNEHTNPPRAAGRCDIDGSPLIQRDDDRAETVRARLALTLTSLRDVAAHYRNRGVLRSIDGVQPIEAVSRDLIAAFDAPDVAATAGDAV